jgi:hypothetical protein
MLPRKEEIEAKALELWHERRAKDGDPSFYINPTRQELRESGFLSLAQSELMRDSTRAESEEWEGYNESFYTQDLEEFPIDLIMKEGCFVVGGRGSGKTNLLKLLVSKALKRKIRVKVIDPSLAWKNFILPTMRVRRDYRIISKWNLTYDVSRLSVLEAKEFVRDMMFEDLKEAVIATDQGYKPKCLIVLEETQNLIPTNTLRTKKYMETSRYITQGRNFGLSYIASSQRLASVDINLVEISGVKYFFKLEGHRNLTKARYWLSKYETWNLRNLETGSAYLQIGSKVKMLKLPLFKSEKVLANV